MSFVTTALMLAAPPAVMGFAAEVALTEIDGTMVAATVPLLVGSAIDVAVKVTGLLVGTEDGAVNVVVYGEAPELDEGLQLPGLHCQVTPELEKSSATTAVRVNCPPVCTAFSEPLTVTLTGGGGSRLNETVALWLGLAADEAVMVTGNVVSSAGIEAGAL